MIVRAELTQNGLVPNRFYNGITVRDRFVDAFAYSSHNTYDTQFIDPTYDLDLDKQNVSNTSIEIKTEEMLKLYTDILDTMGVFHSSYDTFILADKL